MPGTFGILQYGARKSNQFVGQRSLTLREEACLIEKLREPMTSFFTSEQKG